MVCQTRTIAKFDRIAGLAFHNALRLHNDAITLFESRSYASSLTLSILSMEEIAKAHLVEDMVWNARVNDWALPGSWDEFRKALHSHRWKQTSFAFRSNKFRRHSRSRFNKLADSGKLEELKQGSVYVGLSVAGAHRKGHRRVLDPQRVSPKKTAHFITIVNDYLLDLTVGVICGYFAVDADSIEESLNKSLLSRLSKSWKFRGSTGKIALRKYRKMGCGLTRRSTWRNYRGTV